MAEEEVVVTASPAPSDHKRKLEDLEPQETLEMVDDLNSNPKPKPNSDSDSVKKTDEDEEEGAVTDGPPEAKRPRSDTLATENGYQMEKLDELNKEDNQQSTVENNTQSEDAQPVASEDPETVKNEQPSTEDNQTEETQQHTVENPQLENAEQEASGEKLQERCAEVTQQVDASSADQQPESETQTMSRKMEVPNNKAVAGGSPSLVARSFSTSQPAGAAEQLQIQVPLEKVGLILGKGGETIKNLQTRSGARIQLIPQHLPEGDHYKERTVRVTGDKKQIEIAREMIKDVMNQSAYMTISLCKALEVERPNGHKTESLEGEVKLLTKSLAEKQKALGYFEQRALEAEEKVAELEAMLQVCKSGGLEMYQRFLKIPALKFADGFRYGFEQGGKPEAERDYKDPDDFDADQAIDSFGEYGIPVPGEAELKFVDFLKSSCSTPPSTSVVSPSALPPPDQIMPEVPAPARKGTPIVDSFDQNFSKEDGAAPQG